MKGAFLVLCLGSLAAARNINLKAFEIDFCEASNPQPLSINVPTIEPFPIPVVSGTEVNVDVEFDLLETCPVGTTVKLDMVLQGLINIPIPCLEVDGMHLGSCEYDIDY